MNPQVSFRSSAATLAVLCISLLAACSPAQEPREEAMTRSEPAAQDLTAKQCAFFDQNGKDVICHATGSASNPFVVIRTSDSGCANGHAGHPRDRIAVNGDCGPNACLPITAPCDPTVPCCNGLACQAGSCVDLCANVICSADQCQTAGSCNPSTGLCIPPTNKADGVACDDGNKCTQTDACKSGACVGANPVICSSGGQCQVALSCDPASGACQLTPPASASSVT
jgi:hypothetical protein